MKRYLTTIVLLAIAIGLGVWVWRDRERVSEGERRNRENNVFAAWRREDLSRIEIAHEGESIVIARDAKTDTAWRMTSPRSERVDQQAIERLATSLEFATRVRKVGASDNLGLERPRASGSITMGSVVFRFALGAPSPRPEGSSYLRIDDGEPFVASKELTTTLLASADTYRDRSVVPYLSVELARFEVVHPDGGFVIQRLDERSFKVPSLGVLASRSAVDKVWSALAEMRAEAFPKDADADRLTAKPRMTIKMDPKDLAKPVGELLVGEACPGHPDDVVVLRKLPTRVAACAPRGAIDALADITPLLLVDKRPFGFRHDEIEELRMMRVYGDGPKAIEIARRGTGFHQREPDDRELTAAESESASELLVAIERTEAIDVVPNHGEPFEALARARIRVGEQEELLSVGEPTGAPTARIHRQRDDALLTVPADVVRRFIPRTTSFRPLALLAKETRKVTRVVLHCGMKQELEDTGEGFRLTSPAGYETDSSIVQLIDGIVRGKVLAWVADRDPGTFGLANGNCRVVLGFADGNTPATIIFGRTEDGGVYGTIDGDAGVFFAPNALRELAQRIYVSRAALRTPPEIVTGVSVLVKGAPAATVPLAKLRDAAGSLYAERALSLGSNFLGPADVELQISVADGGPPKRIVCVKREGTSLSCATQSVKAIYEVKASAIARFLVGDAGLPAVDAH